MKNPEAAILLIAALTSAGMAAVEPILSQPGRQRPGVALRLEEPDPPPREPEPPALPRKPPATITASESLSVILIGWRP